ncbi:MAG: sulfur modification protein DndC [Blastocatellia bacterium]|jgi:DNA sulfur modification protein DndC|nr:sulfur modification protein DndC [Blastocatellia bacterium]
MASPKFKKVLSAFLPQGFKTTVDSLIGEIQEVYLSDRIPWVLGYSGGKDSTAALQLVWLALAKLTKEQRVKPVHVITTDTLVENPIVAAWVTRSLETMKAAAERADLPIFPHRLTPQISDTYWVNLIGRGYPAPRPKFRWCTERLKINPSNAFITGVVRENGEAIVILGTRKAESAVRARVMEKLEQKRIRDRLSPNTTLPNSLVFSPIEDWSNDDVWLFLMQVANPWGYDNKHLLTMYQGATPDGECPLVIDTTTPSCGDSRFGCWVCTLVDKDKSMTAMIQNDDEKEWMLPLLELRNALDSRDDEGNRNDRHLRDFRRLRGTVDLFNDRNIPGPYTQDSRHEWLRKILTTQQWVRENGPEHVRQIELISLAELHEIRRIWVVDKHEVEDTLPKLYEEVTKEKFPGQRLDDNQVFGADEISLLKDICGGDQLHFELTRDLLDVERRFRTLARRAGLYDALEQTMRRGFYEGAEDAIERARQHRAVKNAVEGENGRTEYGVETIKSLLDAQVPIVSND